MVRLQILQVLRGFFLFKWDSTAIVENSCSNKWDENSKISYKCIQHKPKSLRNLIYNDIPSLEFAFEWSDSIS